MNPLNYTNTQGNSVFKLGLPGRTQRILPKLSDSSKKVRTILPIPNIMPQSQPLSDNRDSICKKILDEQKLLLYARADHRFIDRN